MSIVATHRLERPRWLGYAIAACLVLWPTLVYWNAIFARYGFRDDYANLLNVIEDPSSLLIVQAGHGRPLYGWLLDVSLGLCHGLDDLCWIRLATALLLGCLSLATFRLLRQQGWSMGGAAAIAVLLPLLPSAQVELSWAICMPHVLATLAAAGAFALAQAAAEARLSRWRWAGWAGAVVMMTVSALIYPATTMFYFMLMAAAAVGQQHALPLRTKARWLARHFVVAGTGLGTAYAAAMVGFAMGWAQRSERVSLTSHLLGKLLWVITGEPLHNALAVFVLNDASGPPATYRLAVVAVAVLLLVGVGLEWRRQGARAAWWWVAVGVLSLAGAGAVNALVAGNNVTYRMLLPLTAVVLVLAVRAAMSVAELVPRRGHSAAWIVLAILALGAAWTARRQTRDMFVRPQQAELRLLEAGVARIDLAQHPRVGFIMPAIPAAHAPGRFEDEFGDRSLTVPWFVTCLSRILLWERYPKDPAVENLYSAVIDFHPPAPGSVDLVIDLRL